MTPFHSMFEAWARGFFLCCGLIVALGPQNLFVIRMGAASRQTRLLAGALCAVCDAALIVVGMLGGAALAASVPALMRLCALLGGVILVRTAAGLLSGTGELPSNCATAMPRRWQETCREALAYSLLNPHAILDTVIIIGSVGSIYAGGARCAFGLGACAASALWYWLLGHCGRIFLDAERGGRRRRLFEQLSGVLLLGFAARLVAGVLLSV